MPRYRITDSTSGRTLLVEGDAPPTEADAEELFATSRAVAVAPPPDSANAAQSTAAPRWRNPYGLDTGRPIQAPPNEAPLAAFDESKPTQNYFVDKTKRLGRGLAQLPGQTIEYVGQMADATGRLLAASGADQIHAELNSPLDERFAAMDQALKTPTPGTTLIRDTGREMRKSARDLYKGNYSPDPARDSELGAKVADNAASVAGALITPGGLITKTITGALLNSQGQSDEARQIMLSRGATEKEADDEGLRQFVLNLPAGAFEAIPWAFAIKRFGGARIADAVAEKYGKTALRRVSTAVFGQAATNATEEVLQNIWSNAAAKLTYDPTRTVTEGSGEAALVGAALGAGFGGTLQTTAEIANARANRQNSRARAAAPEPDAPIAPDSGSVVPDQPRPVDQVQLTPAGLPPFDPTRSARDIVLPPVPPRPSARPPVDELPPVAPVPPSAPAQVAPPEPLPAPVDNAPVVATPAKPLTPDEAPTVLADGDVIKVPRAEIAQRPDLMQFKRIDEGASGVNAEDKLTGTWDNRKAGLLQLWEPARPSDYGLTGAQRYIVANGHHRVEFGDRVDNKIYNSQVLREVDGYSVGDARRIGAEINIADGKGNIYDQAKFVRDIAATHGPDEALAAARRIGARGRKATNIGIAAGPDAFDAFINERIGPDHAEQIALAAPGNDGLQRVGVGAALRGANAQEAANLVRAAAAMPAGPQGAQGDLFGADDSALLAMEAQAKRATAIQNQLTEDIRAVQGAAKNPAAAKKYGVDVKDQAGLEAKLAELKALRARWDNWHLEPDLVAQVRPAPPEPVAPPPVVEAPPQDPNQIDMFGGEPPSAPPTKLGAYNGSALLPPPEKLDLPMQPEMPPAKFSAELFQGRGAPLENVYGPEAVAEGRAVPVLGPGNYYAFNKKDAANYGTVSTHAVQLQNPLVLTTGAQWRALIVAAKATHLDSRDALFYRDPAGIAPATVRLKAYVQSQGHDGIIVRLNENDKSLKETFGHDTVVVYDSPSAALDNPGEAGMVREDAPGPQSQNPAAAAEAVGNLPGAAGGLDLPNAQGEAPAVALSRPPRGLKEIEAAIMRGTIDRDRAAALFNRWFDVQAGKAKWQQFWDKQGNPTYLSITDAEAQALSRAVAAFDQGTAKFKWPSTELRKKGGATGGHWSDPGPNDAEAGRIDTQLLFPLARAVVGGIAGYLEGDTPEEKLAYALAGGLGLGLLGSRRLARRTLAALTPARAPVPSYPFDPGKPLRAVNAQGVVVGSHTMGALEHVRAIEMPELVHLARQLSNNDVGLRNFPKASGMFKASGTDFRIELDRRIFSDPVSAQRTMAHELGHMIDYLDDQTMNRGNLLGRIAVLRDHLATTLPDTPWNPNQALQPKDRARLRRNAEKEVGKRPAPDDEAALAAWKEAVAKAYVEKVDEIIAERGLIREQEVRAELIGITEWWRPYEADKVSAGYIDYRNSSKELYADALSVLFNAPSELRDRAPVFFDSWMSYLDRKPEAKRALQDAWHFLHQGQAAVVAARDDRIKAGFVKAEEFLINHARERELDRTTLRGIVDQTKQEWWNIYYPIIARGKEVKAAGVKLPWHKDPEFFFDAHALAENENYLLLERLQRTVVAPLEASGQTREDLGLYLFHNRVLNERYTDREGAVAGRSVIANPDGITPIQARMKLMLQRVPGLHSTPEQRVAHRARLELLESSARQVQDAFADLVRNGHQAGVFSDEQLALTEANRYAYAPFAVVDYLLRSDHVPAGIKQQVGTLQKVANPYLTFVLKGMAVAKLTELNRAKTLTVDLLTAHFPASIERAPERRVKLADGSMMNLPPPPAPRGKTTLTLLRKGKLEAYYVEPAYTKMFDDQMPASANVVAKTLNYTMRNFFHPLFITYNPGFVYAANPMSDNLRSYYALPPGAARRKWIAENRAVWESARSRVAQDVATQDMPRKRALVALRKQRPLTPAEAAELKTLEARGLAYEAIATRALASPADSFAADAVNTDDLWSRMLREHALLSDEPGRVQVLTNKYLPTVVKTAKMIERHGMMSEALPKLATYSMLGKTKGWSREEIAFYVRNQIGTPNVYKKGSRAVFNGSFLPYINVFTRGMEADVALLRGKTVGPESRSRKAAEFWRRMTEASFVPSLLQALAMVGVFGAALKKVYDGFSDYDKTNYLIIPLGTWETDTVYGYKSAGIRIRLTETMRFANAFLQHVVTRAADNDPAASASLAGLVEFGAGQVPGLHPLASMTYSWGQFAAGQQPRDMFRGSPVVQTADWKAGGWDRTKGMLAYTWGESGLGGMVRFDPKSQNIMEFSASATPVVNRLIRWSDSGLREREQRLDKIEADVIYKIRSQMPKVVNELLQEYSTLKSMGERRDDRQEVRYKDLGAWHLKVWEPTYKEMKEAKPKDWSAYGVSLGIDSAPYGRGNQK